MELKAITDHHILLDLEPYEARVLARGLLALVENDEDDFNSTEEQSTIVSAMRTALEAAGLAASALGAVLSRHKKDLTLEKYRRGMANYSDEMEAEFAARDEAARLVFTLNRPEQEATLAQLRKLADDAVQARREEDRRISREDRHLMGTLRGLGLSEHQNVRALLYIRGLLEEDEAQEAPKKEA